MPVIRDGGTVADAWRRLADAEPLPRAGDVILPLERLKAAKAALAGRRGRVGVELPNSADVRDLGPLLAELDLIALHFPAFTDGRAYSQARQLRAALGYRGELRATGDVLADQAAFMVRVGFDSFEITGTKPLRAWERALRSMSLAYQRGYGGAAVASTARDGRRRVPHREERQGAPAFGTKYPI